MKKRSDQKQQAALDEALADTFPASDPISMIQPTSAGAAWPRTSEVKPAAPVAQSRKEVTREPLNC